MSRTTLTFFLLILSFGILFAGCGQPELEQGFEDFTFSDTDLSKVHTLTEQTESEAPGVETTGGTGGTTGLPAFSIERSSSGVTVLSETIDVKPDIEKQRLYDNIRLAVSDQGGNIYRVNNPFLNVRQGMDVNSAQVTRLNQGDTVTVLDVPSAQWAKIKLAAETEGYVAFRYLAKLTTEQRLPEEKKQFEGKYFVDYAFLNMRKDPSTQSEKMGELPGQTIIKPLSMNGEWARVAYNGKEGYVSTQYLKPFQPVFLVREEEYALPILQYAADDTAAMTALTKHVASLRTAGKKIVTLKSFYDMVLGQESRDVRVSPDAVVLLVTGVNAKNLRQVTDALQSASVPATLFLQTRDLGLAGITEKTVLTLLANGYELQSAGHTGDDLRGLTDSQVTLEIGQSKKLLEELTRKEVYAVAYPRNGVNDRIVKEAQTLGYLFGVTDSPDLRFSRSQFLRLPSIAVVGGMTADAVVKTVSGR
ncbi:MAG: SH3 domain-containing protein [Candidatus Peribacteraceae bacterium]|nr:SH3 domain-containing protein [Candidatus Peribacteraceae bacterium]